MNASLEHQRPDVVAPAAAREDAVMAGRLGRARGSCAFFLDRQAGAEIERRNALTGGRDVVLAAFDVLTATVVILPISTFAIDGEAVLAISQPLEDALDGGEVELRRHVHHGEVFVVELVVLVVVRRLALGHAQDLVGEGLGVASRRSSP
jgi:hypothetical protein